MYPEFTIDIDPEGYRDKIIDFLHQYKNAVMLDSNSAFNSPVPLTGIKYDFIAACGVLEEYCVDEFSWESLQKFLNQQAEHKRWVFGFLTYDIKNEIEELTSGHSQFVPFPKLHFFVPQFLIIAQANSIKIISYKEKPEIIWKKLNECKSVPDRVAKATISYVQRRELYLSKVKDILSHIRYGDIYELNYCHEVRLTAEIDSGAQLFKKLTSISPNPFSAYYRLMENYLVCASPERFLHKNDHRLFSQPIKGTAARADNVSIDQQNKNSLLRSEKESSENVMIVDLVRNDLSKIAMKGTVKVDELTGVYSFRKVHQMISTISCEVKHGITFTDIIKALFPMGSMTGAPKIKAMELIEKFENFRRGLFSGTVGYIDPDGNFDFNVVIRSIVFNETSGNVSIAAGGAITAGSEPEQEYNETLIKIAPQLNALGIDVIEILNFNDAVNHA